jgi:hypothetical protein
VLELAGLARSEHLGEGTGVQLVHHLAVAILGSLEGIGFELVVVLEGVQLELLAPLVDGVHVATGRRGSRSRGGSGLWSRSGSWLWAGCGLRSWLRLGSRGEHWLLSRLGLRLDWSGSLSGAVVTVTLITLSADYDCVDNSLIDNVDILTFLVTNGCGSSEDGTREGEERKSLDSVHFDVGDIESIDFDKGI